jgi:hypothetical protein
MYKREAKGEKQLAALSGCGQGKSDTTGYVLQESYYLEIYH